ncbi:MAG: AAA family ATPase [Clostridiaceae bacterium]|nr:AAA family ATPase [Clostridiaceae bacterium]
MEELPYSSEQLLEIGKNNYERLALHCQTLEVSGFWEQARKVMQKSSTEILDTYVQSVLMKLAVDCGNVLDEQMDFIRVVTLSNPLQIEPQMEIDDSLRHDIDKLCQMPPVLIQLCSLYDKERGDDMTEYFIDALLNILLCMAYLNGGKDEAVDCFIKEYYNKICYLATERTQAEHIRYIRKKLGSRQIVCHVDRKQERREQNRCEQIEKQAGEKQDVQSKEEQEPEDEKPVDRKQGEQKPEDEKPADRKQEERKPATAPKGAVRGKKQDRQMKLAGQVLQKSKEEEERELSEQAKQQFMLVKQRIQSREQEEERAKEEKIKELVGELNSLVGLSSVKEEIQSLINLIKIRKLRSKMNLPEMEMTYHMVFTGSPGTGKTTVARLVAKIYKELGILSEGTLVETDRSGLVAGYVGQTAIKVHELVEQAEGGILFIDEAYSLANPDIPNDFGREAVDTLVKLMEDHRDNLVVIVAGYTEEMQKFLKSNTGLISRFNKFIDFPDYSREELVSIMEVMANKAGLQIDKKAKDKVFRLLSGKKKQELEDFGNARGIRNLFEKFVINQANRLVLLENPQKEDLLVIQEEDVVV